MRQILNVIIITATAAYSNICIFYIFCTRYVDMWLSFL